MKSCLFSFLQGFNLFLLQLFIPFTISLSNTLIKRGIRSGLCSADVSSLAELVYLADDALFQCILYNPNNVLHSLLPDLNATGHYLRHRRHDRVLPPKTGSLQINNFLIRQLYKDSY